MVNVTKANFLTTLRDFLLHLPTSSYIAIDEEMTGIRINHKKPNKAELPSERYVSSWKGVPERYGILQVGVALFHKNPEYKAASASANAGASEVEGGTGGPGVGAQEDPQDEDMAQDANDENEHQFMHREGALNQDELEDMTEREEEAATAHPTKNGKDVPEYTSRIYNFYLFPNAASPKDVTLASDTIQFLIENNMDFNKVFSEGISFTTTAKAEELKSKFMEKKAMMKEEGSNGSNGGATPRKSGDRVKLSRTEDIAFVARTMASLREWIDTENGNDESNTNEGKENDPDTGVGRRQTEGSSLVLPPCNAFLRRCLYETIEAEYPGLVLERADSGPNAGAARNQIRVIRLSSTDKKRREQRLLQEEWDKILYTVGFTTIFQAISAAGNGASFSEKQTDAFIAGEVSKVSLPGNGRKVPLIVHNGLMDIMFLLTHCHDGSLPGSFEDTKELIRSYFPLVYDTKILATECSDSVVRGGSTALGDLYESIFSAEMNDLGLKRSPIVNGENTEQAHEAAWDAYMTGCCFYTLSKKILDYNRDSRIELDRVLEHEPVGSLHRASLGLNKLYMHLSLYTIDLQSASGVPGLNDPLCHGLSVNTTFYVTGIDSTVSTRDILRALTEGTQNQTELIHHLKYEIVWMDDESFFVGTKLDNLISVNDTGSIQLIALHVHNQLHAGLRGIKVVDLADYFQQKHTGNGSFIGSFTSAVSRLFGGAKRSQKGGSTEQANKRRRVN